MSIASMHQILDNLWLGDMVGSQNKFLLKKNSITHILTVAMGIMPKFPTQFSYKLVSILDCPSANLKIHFQSCIKFIKDAIAGGGTVLVHCFAGVSRSATIVIAYLMQELGMSMVEAIRYVKSKRYFINPNDGFKRQLQQFQRELNAKRAQKEQTPNSTSIPNSGSQEETKINSLGQQLEQNKIEINGTSQGQKTQVLQTLEQQQALDQYALSNGIIGSSIVNKQMSSSGKVQQSSNLQYSSKQALDYGSPQPKQTNKQQFMQSMNYQQPNLLVKPLINVRPTVGVQNHKFQQDSSLGIAKASSNQLSDSPYAAKFLIKSTVAGGVVISNSSQGSNGGGLSQIKSTNLSKARKTSATAPAKRQKAGAEGGGVQSMQSNFVSKF